MLSRKKKIKKEPQRTKICLAKGGVTSLQSAEMGGGRAVRGHPNAPERTTGRGDGAWLVIVLPKHFREVSITSA